MTNTICPTCGQELPVADDTFGTRVQAARVEQEMTRQDLATSLGYERTSIITRWESGQLQPSEIAVVESVAAALRVTPAWLLYGVMEAQLFTVSDPTEPPAESVDEVDEYELWPDDLTDEEIEALEDTKHVGTSESTRPAILDQLKGEST